MIREHPYKAMGASPLEGQLSPYFNSPTSQIRTKTPAMNRRPSRHCHPPISLCFPQLLLQITQQQPKSSKTPLSELFFPDTLGNLW